MTDKEVMQMALDVLESLQAWPETPENFNRVQAIEALRAALAQPEHPDAQGSPCPEFWNWLPKAYGQTESFSKYNMEVAYLAGKKAQPERAECDGGQCGIGGYCKQCPKPQQSWCMAMNKCESKCEDCPDKPEPEPVAWISIGSARMIHWTSDKPAYGDDWEPLYTAPPQRKKLWLWKNFVDGKPEYWAFDNPYPTNLDDGDPQTLGQPCGYAIFKESRDGSCGRTEEQVLREMKNVAPPKSEWQGLTDEEANELTYASIAEIEAKLKEKNT